MVLILCAQKDEAVAWYALEGLPNKVMASEYRTALPDEKELAAEIERTQALLKDRKRIVITPPEAVRPKKSVKTKYLSVSRKGASKGQKGHWTEHAETAHKWLKRLIGNRPERKMKGGIKETMGSFYNRAIKVTKTQPDSPWLEATKVVHYWLEVTAIAKPIVLLGSYSQYKRER